MITLDEAARATGGAWLTQPLPGGTPLRAGAFDTRALGDTDIFFALSGEGADGHDYLHALGGSAVRLAVVSRSVKPEQDLAGFSGAVLQVRDTLAALGDMARYLVEKFRPVVVAITGSYGKTTAKEEIAHVLAGARRVLKSPGSHNNEIGIPLTLLALDGTQEVTVLEFSARKEGDIDYLGRIAPPDIAVLLAVGHAHIGVFGSREAIFRAKGEIFNHLRPGGLAVVGAGQPRLSELAAPHRTVSFGLESGELESGGPESGGLGKGDLRAEQVTRDKEGKQRFTGVYGDAEVPLRASMPGPHGCEPVLAAWAVARELGLTDAQVAERAGGASPQKGRLNLLKAPGGAALIDDSYNASPETVINLIETLNARPERDRVLVLGPLAEMEEGLVDSARAIAEHLGPPLGQMVLYEPSGSVGGLSTHLIEEEGGARDDFTELRIIHNQPELIAHLRALDHPGRVIGIKGARSAHMERIAQALLGVTVACERHPCPMLKYCTDCEHLTGT